MLSPSTPTGHSCSFSHVVRRTGVTALSLVDVINDGDEEGLIDGGYMDTRGQLVGRCAGGMIGYKGKKLLIGIGKL